MPLSPAAITVRPTVLVMPENNAKQSPVSLTRALCRRTVDLDSGKNVLLEAAKDLSGKKLAALDNVKIAEPDYFSNYWIGATENISESAASLPALTNAMKGFFKNMEKSDSTQLLMLSEHAQIILERNNQGAIMFSDANLANVTVVESEYLAIDEKLTCDVIRALHGETKYEALMERINRNAAADAATKKMESMSFSGLQNGEDSSRVSTLAVFATSRVSEVSKALMAPCPLTVVDELKPELLANEIVAPALKSGPVLTSVPTGFAFSENLLPESNGVHNGFHRSDSIGSCSSLSELESAASEETVSQGPASKVGEEFSMDFTNLSADAPDEMGSDIVSQKTDDVDTSEVGIDVREERESSEAKELEALIFSTLENGAVDPEWESTNIIDGIIENLTGTARNIEDRTLYKNLKTDKLRLAESTRNNQIKLKEAQKKLQELPVPPVGDIPAAARIAHEVCMLDVEISHRSLQLQMAAETLEQEKKCSVKLVALFNKICQAKRAEQDSLRIDMLKKYNAQRVLFTQASDRQDSIETSPKQHNDDAKPEAATGPGSNNVALSPVKTEKIAPAIDSPEEADKKVTTRSHRVFISSTNSAANKKMVDALAKYKKFKSYATPAEAELEMKTTEAELTREMMENMLPILSDNAERLFEPEGEGSTQAIDRSSFRRTAMTEPNRTLGTPGGLLSRQQLRDVEQGANL